MGTSNLASHVLVEKIQLHTQLSDMIHHNIHCRASWDMLCHAPHTQESSHRVLEENENNKLNKKILFLLGQKIMCENRENKTSHEPSFILLRNCLLES